ncbi:ATP-binding cassette domain-containing protein [Myxococcota bacterium]|nr:ATP-binding cassette domain-containing protein [Myxococcota bacterium]
MTGGAPPPGGISLRGVGYRYPSAPALAVAEVDLDVSPGEVVLLTGPTGCGKSTALRLAAGLLQRHGAGEVRGQVRVGGEDPATTPPGQRVRLLGLVGQEPGDQLVAGTLADEVAFAMESAGMSPREIEARLPALLSAVGLDLPPDRDPRTLSGGQTQRLVTAAALSAGARALVLDEPVAQLDPLGARALLQALRALADDGVAVLLVEHRLEACWPLVDRVVVMAGGRVVDQAARAAVGPGHPLLGTLRRLGLRVPATLDLADRLGRPVEEAERWTPPPAPAVAPLAPGEVLLEGRALTFRHPGAAAPAVRAVDLALRVGERLALLGGNGAGKSTLLALLSGELPAPGLRATADRVAVPQDPDLALFCETVAEELAHGPRERGARDPAAAVDRAARALSVADLRDRAPQALSRGQRLRVAVAAALACQPRLLLLDEPTSGQDHDQVEAMFVALRQAMADGALVFATHDVDLALRHATAVLVLDGGRVVARGAPGPTLLSLPAGVPLEVGSLARLAIAAGRPGASAAELLAGAP